MPIDPGTRLGPYAVGAQIGAGGMGEVYRATDTRLGRDVAIKVLPASLAQDPDRLARFDREARTLAALNHPNIAAILGLEDAGGAKALVMEMVEGPTLADRIAQGPIPIDEALPIARQMADALAAAHDQGIVHRDLKPANIKVRPDGTVKVLDFGLAKAMDSVGVGSSSLSLSPTLTSPAMTQAGLILGTAAYMSPEQARGKTVDKRSDIWAFGCVVFEMMTGTRAFDAEDVSLTLSVVLQKEPDFSVLPSSVPSHVVQTLRLCLRKDPRQRPSDINDVRLALDGAFHVDPPTTAPAQSSVSAAARLRVPWAVAAAALVLTAVAGYGWWRSTRPVERPLVRLSVDLGPDAVRVPRDSLALSPDGNRIVFVGRSSDPGTRQLYTRRLDEPAATPIAGTIAGAGLTMPFFSPRGDWIGFVVGTRVAKVPVQGGSSFFLTDAGTTPTGVSWGDDDRIIIGSPRGLLRIPASGGTLEVIKGISGAKFMPHILPGGKAVLANSASLTSVVNLDDLHIDVFNTDTGEVKPLVPAGYSPRYLPIRGSTGTLVFIREGTLFGVPFDAGRLELRGTPVPLLNDIGNAAILDGGGQFTFSETGTFAFLSGRTIDTSYQIAWLTSVGQTTPLVKAPAMYVGPRLSPDGAHLAYTVADGKAGEVWVYDLNQDAPRQLTFTGPGVREVAWSPDSKHLVYGDGQSLWWIRADGSAQPQRLLENASNPRPANFSPDGRLVFSRFGTQGLPDIWTLPIDLSNPEQPKPGKAEALLTEDYVEVDPAFSLDGKFLAYATSEAGANELYVRAYRGSGKWKISSGGGKFPAWSRTSRELFFLGGDDRIMVAGYTVNGDTFTVTSLRPWSQTQVLRDGVRQNFDITPDGKRVVMYPKPVESKTEGSLHATFLLNFFDEVRRRIP